jgi:signal transduction histidine kinase
MEDSAITFFLDRLVHDLREPLRSVTAFSEVLKEQTASRAEPDDKRVLDEILEGGERIRTIADALSRFSLALEEPAAASRCSLRLAADMAAIQLDRDVQAAGATLDFEKLPALEVAVRLERMTQIMEALLSNALRFRGETPLLIRVSACAEDDSMATVLVEDNGLGIGAADREKIFLPFTRVHGRKYPGAGLGLTIARRIAENHGGALRVAHSGPPGAVFELKLPC